MINSTRNFFKHSFIFSAGLLLLQGCGGGERTAPYNGGGSSSSSSVGAAVSVSTITNGNSSNTISRIEKQHLVMRDSTEYNAVASIYSNTTLGTEDFTRGQVVLIDMGNVDVCKDHLNLSGASAHEEGNESVKIVVRYTESAASTTSCTSSVSRPYYFYYVQSTKLILFEEDISL